MCDFRGPPHSVKNIETGEIITIDQVKRANGTDYDHPDLYGPQMKDITEPGLYHICATGAFYAYFDGQVWWPDFDDPTKYEFLR